MMKRLKKIIDVKVLFSFLIGGLFSTFILLPLGAKAEGEDPVVINIPTEIQSEGIYPWISKLVLGSGDEALELSISSGLKVSKICHSDKCVDVEKLYDIDNTIIPDITGNIQSINSNINSITGDIQSINSNINSITGDIQSINLNIDSITGSIESINQNIGSITGEVSGLSGVVDGILSTIGSAESEVSILGRMAIVDESLGELVDNSEYLQYTRENCSPSLVGKFYRPDEKSLSVCLLSGTEYSWVELANTNPNLE